ncbi:MAG TPA: hypothetical protein VFY72_00650 [Beijerinckiaceae bacterium]|nr:hypothetical protein [Beijerinckiaceae bacterium]
MLRMPTSALLQRVEQHISRLDRALKETEDLLNSLRACDREDWIRQLQERLTTAAKAETCDSGVVLVQPPQS